MLERWRTKSSSNNTGAAIEQKTRRWLQQQGSKVVECNYNCGVGEIDIIMRDNGYLVFVEVRYRRQSCFGDGLESVDWRKQKKLRKAAAC